jgi:FkbM family methyltransferase
MSDDQEFITDIYRGLLNRDPDETGMRHFSDMLRNGTLDRVDLIMAILSSTEFASRKLARSTSLGNEPRGCGRSEAEAVFSRFRKYEGTGRPRFITNFLGGLTDITFLNLGDAYSGIVEDYPIPGNFHGETLEWIGTLRSVLDAKDTFTMLELGAGWAPWCVIGYLAAKQVEIAKINLLAVEGDRGHIDFIRQTFAANGISSSIGRIIHGVAGTTDGDALFPKATDASRVYGGTAAYSETEQTAGVFADFVASQSSLVEQVEKLPCFSLATLMRDYDQVDLIHCDIQGAEANLFADTIEMVSTKVKRVVIGTHSFEIDRCLGSLFSKHGWDLEGINVCDMIEDGERLVVALDGVQVWKNTRF